MKKALLLILLAFPFVLLQAQEKAAPAKQPEKKAPIAVVQILRYQVLENREEGLLVAIWKQYEVSLNIPGSLSSTGGGGGIHTKVKKWEDSGKEAWIPHTAMTENFENEIFFTAKVSISGKTKRIWLDAVTPQHDLIAIIPEPAKKTR